MIENTEYAGMPKHRLSRGQKEKNGKMSSSVKWNFQKYLVDEEGRLIDVFYSITKPMSKKITKLL